MSDMKQNNWFNNKQVDVVVAPRPIKKKYFFQIVAGAISLFKGMKITLGYFLRPSTIVTQQYPENREHLKLADRYRAQLRLIYDERGEHNCTGCKICDKICPNSTIHVIDQRGSSGKKEIDRFIWRFDTCTFCNLCVLACPFDALEMTPDFEGAVFDKRLLTYQLNHYAGPTKKFLDKFTGTEEEKVAMKTSRSPYDAPTMPLTQALEAENNGRPNE